MPTPDKDRIVLVDGSSYLYRAYHALPPLTTSGGEPTGAVYGVVNMLRRLLKDYDPEYIAVVFDARGKTFRDELFDQYKANRPPMPDDLGAQIEPLMAIVEAMGLPLLRVPGVEADDVIGTLADRAVEQDMAVLISTGDKDMAQLVDEHITLTNTMTDTTLDREGVTEKFGVPPERITDYLALVGDSSDNIPGVPKVGPKTAVKWLKEYGDLDSVIVHADEIKGKVGESLRENLDQLELSRRLVQIERTLPLDRAPTALHRGEPDTDTLREWYQRLEFKSWLQELLEAKAPAAASLEYETVLTAAGLEAWLERLADASLIAFDTETTSLEYMQAEIVGVSFAVEPGHAAYVPVAHDYAGAPSQLSRERVLEALRPLLEDADKRKLGHGCKYDLNVLARYGIDVRGVGYDTMLESYVLDSTATRHDLDTLALKYLGHNTIHYEDVAGKGARQLSFDQVPVEQAAPYAAEDADVTLKLHETLWPRLEAEPVLRKLFEDTEMPLMPVLARMERNGVLVDVEMLARQSEQLSERMHEIEGEAHAEAGEAFNLGSPKQIQAILYERLQLPVVKRTPKGQPSTAENVLAELAPDYRLPALILEHRGLSKLKSTYADRLPERVDPVTGRVHTSYHQAVAATGRLSSSDPNLQNIPIRSEEGRRIRQAFIAPPGCRLVAADYSQIELRIMAHLSADERLLQAFADEEDVHRATAAEVFGATPQEVSADQRRSAKAINFGLIYGMSAYGLARQLGIDRGAAQQYVDRYFARYPGVKAFMERTRAQARQQGYVETVFGRRLYVPEINSRNSQRRQYAERTAINAPMQGTAADIIKRAMIGVDEWIRTSARDVKMIMQVHDELVFEIAEAHVEAACEPIRRLMTDAASLDVPLVVELGVGANWEEAH